MYCALSQDNNVQDKLGTYEFWDKLISELLQRSEELGVGDVKDRQDTLAAQFSLPTEEGTLEAFDGLNHEDATHYIFVLSLPVIMRGHAI